MRKVWEYLVTVCIIYPLLLLVKLYHLYLDVKYRDYHNER